MTSIDGRRWRSLPELIKSEFDKLKVVGHSNHLPRDSYTATIFILP